MNNILIVKCKRCGHEWATKQLAPKVCAKCHNPYWNHDKKKGIV